jgi:hypothetical protein
MSRAIPIIPMTTPSVQRCPGGEKDPVLAKVTIRNPFLSDLRLTG